MVTRSRRDRVREPNSAPGSAPPASAPQAPGGVLRGEPGRLLVSLHVTPRAGRDALNVHNGAIRVRLAAAPVDGAANDALTALLASRLRVPRRSVTIVRGATSREKVVAVEGITAADFWARLGG
jgi:uncharacterized protein